jgi:hypothetical protein
MEQRSLMTIKVNSIGIKDFYLKISPKFSTEINCLIHQ